jgi:CheY-like chemotaxis protein
MIRRILLADDDADDRLLFEEVFKDLPASQYRLYSVGNGEEVLSFLDQIKDPAELPDLIILDQNMPLMNGKETLLNIKSSPVFQEIPTIVYSTYNEKSFIDECTRLGANGVVSKPDSYEGYIQMINTFLKYSRKPIT